MVHGYMECLVDGTARTKRPSRGVKRSAQATPSGAPTQAPKVTRVKTPERDPTQRSGPQPSAARSAEARPWTPPAGSWEDDVASIDACQFDPDGDHTFYIAWANGQKTKHGAWVLYQKCPQKASLRRLLVSSLPRRLD
ncbi:hypothetical protein HIM_12511 [Hirsutella minnesotensis 3608]|uniref:Chromo shadow domain-containing protein n=1 Tax=Hirsutella minnesotensis 3608 TaxID=1043627 RepID=A0A0F7ZVZ8_9HYPO|nr:hypothetical protein HIM_12511 [Hirsutella minnesotensis 3608]